MRTITREIVSALIVSSDGKLLFGMKDPNKGGVYADCWHLPGGGVDEGETRLDTLRRETLEEVGVDVNEGTVTLLDNSGRGSSEKTLKETGEKVLCNMIFNVYEVRLSDSAKQVEVNLNDDLVKYQWFEKSELASTKLTPPSVELFQRLSWM